MSSRENRIEIRHSIAGRFRVKVPAVRSLDGNQGELRDISLALTAIRGVRQAAVHPASASIILNYDVAIVGEAELLEVLVEKLGTPDRRAAFLRHLSRSPPRRGRGEGYAPMKPWHLLEVTALTVFLGFRAVRRLFFRHPVSQSPLSATGIVSAVVSIPVVRRAVHDVFRGRPHGLFPYLALSVGLSIVSGASGTALEILWAVSVGLFLERSLARRSRRSVRDLVRFAPPVVRILVDGVEVSRPTSELAAGDMVVVKGGEMIPVDGTIAEGEGLVAEASLTGHDLASGRIPGQQVYAGTTVQAGRLLVHAEKVGRETYLARAIEHVEASLAERTEVERKADVLAWRMALLGSGIAGLWLIFTRSLERSLSALVVLSSPSATVLSASTAITAAIAAGARRGILIKGGRALEAAAIVDSACFDKTGTLTTGEGKVVEVVPRARSPHSIERLLELAAPAEEGNSHPVALAVVAEARRRGVRPQAPINSEALVGRGVRARVEGAEVLVGNQQFLESEGVDVSPLSGRMEKRLQLGYTVLYVAREGMLEGAIAVTGRIRPLAWPVLDWLRRDGISESSLISGDAEPSVRLTAKMLDFDDYQASLLPLDKSEIVARKEALGRRVIMVGDGVNDAPALARATLGVAMGAGGTEAALETADVALVQSDLEDLVRLRQLSRETLRIVRQNFVLALFLDVGSRVLALAGILPPPFAELVHVVHTLGIPWSSGRLLRWEPPGLKGAPGSGSEDGGGPG